MTVPQRGTSPVKRLASSRSRCRPMGLLKVYARGRSPAGSPGARPGRGRVCDPGEGSHRRSTRRAPAGDLREVRGLALLTPTSSSRQTSGRFDSHSKMLARRLLRHRQRVRGPPDKAADPSDEALRDALVRTAALSYVRRCEAVDKESDRMVADLFDQHANAIEKRPTTAWQEYRDITHLPRRRPESTDSTARASRIGTTSRQTTAARRVAPNW